MRALVLALLLCGCAVKGYDLGWRADNRLTPLLGSPRDALSGCRSGPEGTPAAACAALLREVRAMIGALPPTADAPLSLGFRCRGPRCTYANAWQRRDVGTATILPVFKRVVLREARITAVRNQEGAWVLEGLVIRDAAAPGYGPVRVGAQSVEN